MRFYGYVFAGLTLEGKDPTLFTREYDVSSFGFFEKSAVKETFKFVARNSLQSLELGSRHVVTHDKYHCYILMSDKKGLGVFAYCDEDYPRRLAFVFLAKAMALFDSEVNDAWMKMKSDENIPVPAIKALWLDFQDPKKVDPLTSAQDTVEKTKLVMHDNIEKLLANQGSMESLVVKSKDLSDQSKMFYKTAKKMNRCCSLI